MTYAELAQIMLKSDLGWAGKITIEKDGIHVQGKHTTDAHMWDLKIQIVGSQFCLYYRNPEPDPYIVHHPQEAMCELDLDRNWCAGGVYTTYDDLVVGAYEI